MKYETNTVAANLLNLMKYYVGEENAKHRAELLQYMQIWKHPGMTDTELRLAKEHLIEQGEPICSGTRGWWYAANATDAGKGAAFLEERGRDLMKKASLIRAAADRLYGGQLDLV